MNFLCQKINLRVFTRLLKFILLVCFVFGFSSSVQAKFSTIERQSTLSAAKSISGRNYYVSPTGSDTNPGTSETEPWATFNRAWLDIHPGDTLILLDGVYYQTLNPNKREGEPGNPITIRAKNDGQAIIDGQYQRIPVQIGKTWVPHNINEYFVIEGIVARNSSENAVFYLFGAHNNVLRRVSAYNANTDTNSTAIMIAEGDGNLVEDCIASGTGRKMIMVFKGEYNVIRRCFANWEQWDGRNWHDEWPWGDGIQLYTSGNNIIENSISYGHNPTWAISVFCTGVDCSNNKILGSMAINAGRDHQNNLITWGDIRPQPSTAPPDKVRRFGWPLQRVGFVIKGGHTINNTLFQDNVAWGNAGVGLGVDQGGSFENNQLNRATIINNGLDAPRTDGGIGTNIVGGEKLIITNSLIEGTPHQGEGARLTHRYVDGELTTEPLWPWPMEDRIQNELGLSVTELAMSILGEQADGFTLDVTPPSQLIQFGQDVTFTINLETTGVFSEEVTLSATSDSADLSLTLDKTTITPPGQATLVARYSGPGTVITPGRSFEVSIVAKSASEERTAKVNVSALSTRIYLPLVVNNYSMPSDPPPDSTLSSARRVNAPHFDDEITFSERGVFWFGEVDNTKNYADVRVGYNNEVLVVELSVLDQWLWYDTTPTVQDLAAWDAATLYLNLTGNTGSTPDTNSHRFTIQLNSKTQDDAYETALTGDGTGWSTSNIDFQSFIGWRGQGFNDTQRDNGWRGAFIVPFANLGLSGPPTEGTIWGIGLSLHDRDDLSGTSIPDQIWPETINFNQPATWGQLQFGLPVYVPPSATPDTVVTIRQGLNGQTVRDAHVGGHSTCGQAFAPNFFDSWGSANYANYPQINIQNQDDVADWPCFSKYYITFPLDTLPADKAIISASVSLIQFGNANWAQAKPSLIQALTVAEAWDEASLTWNNAPLALENVARSWVHPMPQISNPPPQTWEWDVSQAVAVAYKEDTPLQLAFYSADADYHSGKYFWASEANENSRPTLKVLLGNLNN